MPKVIPETRPSRLEGLEGLYPLVSMPDTTVDLERETLLHGEDEEISSEPAPRKRMGTTL